MHFPSADRLTAPFQSKEAFIDALRTKKESGEHLKVGNERWSNKE
jgi:NCS1 family nucleobase:cation symporter-1